jgi:periplasmic divalent cation tolerance protein
MADTTAEEFCEVIITAPDADWLASLARELIERRLCASAHIVAPVRSIYRWRGSIENATEARAFLRSRLDHLDAIVQFVVDRHPYEVPNVTAVPIVGGNPAYLDWIGESTENAI